MGYIYKIENKINGKVYIGQTKRGINNRFSEHIRDLNNNKHHNKHLQGAWDKYGGDNFVFSVVSSNVPDDELDDAEINCISLFDSFKNGYNLTLGGDGSRRWTSYTVVKAGTNSQGKQNYTILNRNNKELISSIDYKKLEFIANVLNEDENKGLQLIQEKIFKYTVSKAGTTEQGKQNYTIHNKNNERLITSIDCDKLEYIANELNEDEKRGLELIQEEKMFKYTVSKAGISKQGKQRYAIKNKNNEPLIQSIDYDKLEFIANELNKDKKTLKKQNWKKILTKKYKESG